MREKGNGMIQSYKDLQVYERSYRMAVKMYEMVRRFPQEELYGLTSQIKRAATSIPLNIAEGYGKKASAAEFKRFLLMAVGSSNEMNVLLELSKDLGYAEKRDCEESQKEYEEIGKMLNKLISIWQ